ncbi:hypothetical protein, partial [Staphylococcus saprophyticus]|uniref:hypothetical protein n=1 Tax=Staphylococcus saprophyticus TaxID=29385 RepID=UPI001C92EA97
IIPYTANQTPNAKVISLSPVSFLSLKPPLKPLTSIPTIPYLPHTLNLLFTQTTPFLQNASLISPNPNFPTCPVQTTRNIH